MLHFFIPCPWPIPYYAIFIWTRMDYNVTIDNLCTATIESCIEFPSLLSHIHCDFLLAEIARSCQIIGHRCNTDVRRNYPYVHKLRLTYKT